MSTNIFNQIPYLRTSRSFPQDSQSLSVELSKSYIDIANFVNARTIGIYASNRPVITGNQWFLSSTQNKQQSLRQVYTFTAAGSIPHGIDISQIAGFVQIYGAFTNGTNWYPLPLVDTVNVTNQTSIIVTSNNIVITSGGTAPVITSGFCVLEWLAFT